MSQRPLLIKDGTQLTQEQCRQIMIQYQLGKSILLAKPHQMKQKDPEQMQETPKSKVVEKTIDDDFKSKLIAHVYSQPAIWGTTCNSSKNNCARYKAWTHIASIMDTNVEKVMKVWNNLKEMHRKCLERRRSASRLGSKKIPRCLFFEELSFLRNGKDDCKRITETNMLNAQETNTQDTSNISDASQTQQHAVTAAPANLSIRPGSKRKADEADDISHKVDVALALVNATCIDDEKATEKVFGRKIDDEFKRKLIAQVRSQPAIWGTDCRRNKDNYARYNAWTQIASTMDTSVEMVTTVWKSLKDSYKKSIKRGLSTSKSVSGYKFFEELSFLRNVRIIETDSPNAQKTNTYDTSCVGGAGQPQQQTVIFAPTQFSIRPGSKGKDDESDDISHKVDKVLTFVNATSKDEENGDENLDWDSNLDFLHSLLPSLRKMDPKKNSAVRLKIMQIVHDAEFED